MFQNRLKNSSTKIFILLQVANPRAGESYTPTPQGSTTTTATAGNKTATAATTSSNDAPNAHQSADSQTSPTQKVGAGAGTHILLSQDGQTIPVMIPPALDKIGLEQIESWNDMVLSAPDLLKIGSEIDMLIPQDTIATLLRPIGKK